MTSVSPHGSARTGPKPLRCAIYTRKSTEHGLEQAFNSLDNQREAAEAYVKSQAHEGWRLLPELYDDGGFSGGSLERPALQQLLAEVKPAGSTSSSSTRSIVSPDRWPTSPSWSRCSMPMARASSP